MKLFSAVSCASAAVLALTAACSSITMNPTVSTPPQAAAPAKYSGLNDLYVADFENGTILLFKNAHYAPDGAIKTGINAPWGVTLDRSGNLYVANSGDGNVTEYAPGTSTPSFTYSYGLVSPHYVSVDRSGNLFVVDAPRGGYAQVSEYAQGVNYPLHSCTLANPWAIASDSLGDVFVDYNLPNQGGGHIDEFIGGLAGCTPTLLRAHVKNAFGLVLDRKNNIIIADANAKRIDVIPPPYKNIARHMNLRGKAPEFISIDEKNTTVFAGVYNFYHGYVFILNYTTGVFERRLALGRGIFDPYGVVDAPNDVP